LKSPTSRDAPSFSILFPFPLNRAGGRTSNVGQNNMSITSTCRLCNKAATLKNSHIVSKFVWKLSGMIGEKKKFNALCLNDPKLSLKNQQDGFKEYLLCLDCEERRSKLEDAARRRLFKNVRTLNFNVHNNSIIKGLDYKTFKLYSMFQLWMMAVSKNPFFAHVDIGVHEHKLAALILADDPAEPWRYGSTVAVIGGNNADWAGLFSQPERIRLFGQNVYRFVLAGMYTFNYVSSHAPDRWVQHLFLQKDGTWPIFRSRFTEYPDLVRKAQLQRDHNNE
jgi:hypothetical protein